MARQSMTFAAVRPDGDPAVLKVRYPSREGVHEATALERWNGNGYPAHAQGEAIPLAMRVVHLSHDMEAIGRLFSPDQAVEAARDRRDSTYDPALAELFVEHGHEWFDRLSETEPWDAVLALEPEPHRMLSGERDKVAAIRQRPLVARDIGSASSDGGEAAHPELSGLASQVSRPGRRYRKAGAG